MIDIGVSCDLIADRSIFLFLQIYFKKKFGFIFFIFYQF
jgi:hypothetical protein